MAVTGTLEQIRAKTRKITGRLSVNQLSNDDLNNYINDFYVYELPQHLKLWDLTNVESPLFPTTPPCHGAPMKSQFKNSGSHKVGSNINPSS